MIENEAQRQAAVSWIDYWKGSLAANEQSWLGGEQAREEIMKLHREVEQYQRRSEMTLRREAPREEIPTVSSPAPNVGILHALRLIETVGEAQPFSIVPIVYREGTIASAKDVMAARVKWATKAGYTVLTKDVPEAFAPYNAIIRLHHTEDYNRDYLAHIVEA